MKSSFIVCCLLHSLFVCGIPRPKRLVKRAANLNPGFDIEAFRKDQLDLHNHYRALHNVQLMTRDETLTREAQEYAEYLAANNLFQHCTTSSCDSQGAGENLAFASGSTSAETNATLRWYEEVYSYNYCEWTPRGRATTRPGHESEQVGHFTQIVWEDSTKLGIGYARTSDRTKVYVVGRYLRPGNFLGRYEEKVPKANYLLDKYQDNCDGTDGGLTDWSQPSACTKPCGRGIRIETRTCTNPKPSYNGRDCSGETKRISGKYWCNSQACPTTVNERDEQCEKRGYLAESFQFSNRMCTLYCKEPSRRNFFMARGQVDDGTLCHNGNTPIGSCLNGQCIPLEIEPESPDDPAAPPSTTTTTPPPATTTTTPPPTTTTKPPPTTTTKPPPTTTTKPPPTTTTNPPPKTTTTPPPTTTTTPPQTTTTTPPRTTTTTPPHTTTTTPPRTTTTNPPPTTTSAPKTTEAEGSEETTSFQGDVLQGEFKTTISGSSTNIVGLVSYITTVFVLILLYEELL